GRFGIAKFAASVAAGSPTGLWRMSGHPAVQHAYEITYSTLLVSRLCRPNSIEPPWYGPVCPVVWEGWRRETFPYPDQSLQFRESRKRFSSARREGSQDVRASARPGSKQSCLPSAAPSDALHNSPRTSKSGVANIRLALRCERRSPM